MTGVTTDFQGPLAITEERADGRTFVMSGENTSEAARSASAAEVSYIATTRLLAGNPVNLGPEIFNSPAVVGEWPLTLYCLFDGTVTQIVTQDIGAGGGDYDVTVLVNDVPEWSATITPASDLVTPTPGITVALGDKVTVLFDNFTGTVSAIGFGMVVQPTALGSVPGMSGDISASDFTMATAKLLGRYTAATGAIEQVGLDSSLAIVGGDLKVASTPGYTVFDTQATTSGTSVTFSSIPQTAGDLLFAFKGVSHDSGTSQGMNVQFSKDNGSNWTTAIAVHTAAWAASGTGYGSITIYDYRDADMQRWDGYIINIGVGGTGTRANSAGTVLSLVGGINAVRFLPTAGNFDGGSIVGKLRS